MQKQIEQLSLLVDSSEQLFNVILPEILEILSNNNHTIFLIKETVISNTNSYINHFYCSKCSFCLDIEYSARQISPHLDFYLLKVKCDRV
jgi:hypothetical protein